MTKKKYAFRLGDDILYIYAWNKSDAFMEARLMGYKGNINDIRLY